MNAHWQGRAVGQRRAGHARREVRAGLFDGKAGPQAAVYRHPAGAAIRHLVRGNLQRARHGHVRVERGGQHADDRRYIVIQPDRLANHV